MTPMEKFALNSIRIWKQQVFDTDVWRNWLWLLTKSADFFFFLFYLKSSHNYVILDWSYKYHASNMYQQVAPTEIYVKNKNNKQTNKQNKNKNKTKNNNLICSQETTIKLYTFVSVSILIISLTWSISHTHRTTYTHIMLTHSYILIKTCWVFLYVYS